MPRQINVYCDESCHLEHDGKSVMVLGALWCPKDKTREIANRLREIKAKHNLNRRFEAKWTKVSPAKLGFYQELLDYFFDDDDLHFRAVVIADKGHLDHAAWQQDHDTWYYKMLFTTIKTLLDPEGEFSIFLDIKDTRSAEKVRKLGDVLANNTYDFERKIVRRVQNVRSHEVEQFQLVDLLIGIVSYVNRGEMGSKAKLALAERMRGRSHYSLTRTTLYREEKVNLLRWEPRQTSDG